VRNSVYFLNPPSKKNRKLIRNFDCATESKGNYLYQPYDFLLLSSHFEDEEVVLIDAIAQELGTEEVFRMIEKPEAFIIALTDTNWEEDFSFLKTLKEKYSDTPIYVFGDSFIEKKAVDSVAPFVTRILANPLEVDLRSHILGNKSKDNVSGFIAEDTYTRTNLKAPVEVSIRIPKHNKFLLPEYRWPFSLRKKYTTVFTAWGCPYSCSYCVVSSFPNLYRNYREIIKELKYVKSIGLKEIYIGDRSFGLPRNNTINLLKEMVSQKFNFTWSSYFHPNQYDKELLDLMKESGCHTIIIGIESADFDSLKKYGRNVKADRFYALIEHCKRIGIHICGDFMIGLPGETRHDILKTIDFSKKLKLDYASFNIAAPLAGSSLRKDAILDGRIGDGEEKHFDSFGYNKVLSNGVLSSKEILDLRNFAVRTFYLRPWYLLKSFTRIRSLEHLMIQLEEMFEIFKKSR
jgi:uncharacterized radical SAM superfamily protein